MDAARFSECLEKVLSLSLGEQAVCVRLAATPAAVHWSNRCARLGITDKSSALLAAFDQWIAGALTSDAFNDIAEDFRGDLPKDLRKDIDPVGGLAGWALHDIALIALDQCEDVHDDILQTAICYAAAASAGIGVEAATDHRFARLTSSEWKFLDEWWARCCERFPQLRTD